jgi:outer membrane protein
MGVTHSNIMKKRAIRRAFLFALAFSTSVFVAYAPSHAGSLEPNAEQIAAYEQGTEGARIKLLIALAKQGQHELADTLLQRYPLTGKYAANRTLYIQGLILKGRKDNKGAAAKFRTALADDPKLTMVRSDLAQTLVEMGEDDSAKHHLRLLEAEAPNEQAAANIRAMGRHIDQNRPYKFNAYTSLAPTTNFNSGSNHNKTIVFDPMTGTFVEADIDDKSRKKSGLGLQLGGSVSYTKKLSEQFALIGSFGAAARLYKDKSYDSFSLSQSLDLRYADSRGSLTVGVAADEGKNNKSKFDKGTPTSSVGPSAPPSPQGAQNTKSISFGPRVSVSMNVSQRNILTETVALQLQRYNVAKELNGWSSYSDLSWTHLVDSGTNTTASIGFNRSKSGFDAYSYNTYYVGMSFYKELPFGVTTNISGRAQRTLFDEYNFLGQAFRKDNRLIGSLGVVKRDWNIYGFAPSVEYTYSKNFSNLDIYDFDTHAFDIRLTKDF